MTDITADYGTFDQPHYKVWPSGQLEHLACFFPGLLALGAHALRDEGEKYPTWERKLHMDIAKGLATTCYLSYADMSSGLGAESIQFNQENRSWREVYEEWKDHNSQGIPPGLNVKVPVAKVAEKRDYSIRSGVWLSRPEVRSSPMGFICSR